MKTPRGSILRARRWRIALGVLAVAVPAMADAPKTQYAQFDRDALEITDRLTGLTWDRRRVQANTHAGGKIYCNATVFPGGGRLPTVKELLTLVDEEPHVEYDTSFKPPYVNVSIDQLAFPETPIDQPYWTSTPAPAGKFWTVEFISGKTEPRDVASKLNVRCLK